LELDKQSQQRPKVDKRVQVSWISSVRFQRQSPVMEKKEKKIDFDTLNNGLANSSIVKYPLQSIHAE
jgi:hypothetical protein